MVLSAADSKGFTIVEMMIALVISSLLIIASTRLFIGNSQTMRTQNSLAEVNDNGRYVLNRIARDIRMLGFRDQNYLGAPTEGALESENGVNDTLSITYEHPVDCNRAAADASGSVTNVFTVDNGNMMCNGQVFSPGIEVFQVRFGEDLDGDRVANRYVDPDAASLDKDRVVSVLLQVTTVSSDAGGAAGLSNGEATVCSASTDPVSGNQSTCITEVQRLRRSYSITVALRNRI